jgi:hypothetical protein
LTTGGLPTFVDIGHSFGAPAIVEDNLILQVKFLFELDSVFKDMSTVRKGRHIFSYIRMSMYDIAAGKKGKEGADDGG